MTYYILDEPGDGRYESEDPTMATKGKSKDTTINHGEERLRATGFDVYEVNDQVCAHLRVSGTVARSEVATCPYCGASMTYVLTHRS